MNKKLLLVTLLSFSTLTFGGIEEEIAKTRQTGEKIAKNVIKVIGNTSQDAKNLSSFWANIINGQSATWNNTVQNSLNESKEWRSESKEWRPYMDKLIKKSDVYEKMGNNVVHQFAQFNSYIPGALNQLELWSKIMNRALDGEEIPALNRVENIVEKTHKIADKVNTITARFDPGNILCTGFLLFIAYQLILNETIRKEDKETKYRILCGILGTSAAGLGLAIGTNTIGLNYKFNS